MTPSELRAAAEFIKHPVLPLASGATGETEHFVGVVLPRFSASAHVLANHILATFRDDDRDAISDEWWRTLSHAWFADLDGDEKLCLLVHDNIHDDADCRLLAVFSDDGSWGFWEQRRDTNELCNPHHNRFKPVKTRGHVRDLCRVLGIELKEQS